MNPEIENKSSLELLQPLTNEPVAKRDSLGQLWVVQFGNTGLAVEISRDRQGEPYWEQIYLPEGRDFPSPECRLMLKDTTIYPYALLHLLEWWKDEDALRQLGIPRVDFLIGVTHPRMHNFRKKLLRADPPIYEAALINNPQSVYLCWRYQLNLARLAQSPSVIQKLEAIKKRCLKQRYEMASVTHVVLSG